MPRRFNVKIGRFVLLFLFALLVAVNANAQNVVVQWNGIASTGECY
jgi:hypothetical protein